MLYPGSIMPAYDLEMNARKAIIAYLSSATAEDALLILSERPRPLTPQDAAIEAGKQSFARFGCVGCHGLELQGGVPNPNSQGGEVPSLLHASDDYTKQEVIQIIRNGRGATPRESGQASRTFVYAFLEKCTDGGRHQPDRGLSLVSTKED